MVSERPLIGGDALKSAASAYINTMQKKIDAEQNGLFSVFDKWITRVLTLLQKLDPARSWEDSMQDVIAQAPEQSAAFAADFQRLRHFLDRWVQGRFVDYAQRAKDRVHYPYRNGAEFGDDVFLACQGMQKLMQWRGMPLMKTAFDYALYPLLLQELKPRTIFEIGSGSGASAIWLADQMKALDLPCQIHSVDIFLAKPTHPQVAFYQGDCNQPDRLFNVELLKSSPHPWLVIEDAHHNVAAVLEYMHGFMQRGDYLVVEDSEVKRDDLMQFTTAHADYKVDTQFTDAFGRNATCAADSIFIRTQ
jgi:cephalosporin hydroxylase